MRASLLAVLCLASLLPVVTTCGGDSTGPQVPAALNLVNGNGQSGTVGQALANPLVVKVVDASGTGVPGVTVSWSVTSGGGTVSAATTTTDAVGVASVTWTMGSTAGANTASASVSGVPTIAAVTFSATALPGQPERLAFSVQPSAVVAGAAISPAVQVSFLDSRGNTVTNLVGSVVLSITSGTGTAGAVLGGTLSQVAVDGVAAFNSLTIDKAGSGYTLTATAAGLTSVVSSVFAVAVGAAAKLAFTVQPSRTWAEQPVAPALRVTIQDAFGNTVTSASTIATLAISAGTGTSGATLFGTLSATPSSGIATFTDVHIDRAGTGYTLTASAPALSGTTSASFDITRFTGLSAGDQHTCGVTMGAAFCWGSNVYSQLGDSSSYQSRGKPVPVSGGLTFASVAAGARWTCALTPSGAAYCWGDNSSFQSAGPQAGSPTPVAVVGGLTFAAISAGATHTCGVTTGGAAYCWGDNSYGELGNGGGWTDRPVAVSGGLAFRSVTAGNYSTCGVTTGGAAYCWGRNQDGELGNGSTVNSAVPVAVLGGLTFDAVSNGGGNSVCGVTTGGAAYCWGRNNDGQLGDGTTVASTVPVAVAGGLSFRMVSAAGNRVCGVTTGDAAYCWGGNLWGELGNGTTTSSATLVPVSGGRTFVLLSSGSGHTCAVTAGGAPYCWGRNPNSQLGDGTTTASSTPVRVSAP